MPRSRCDMPVRVVRDVYGRRYRVGEPDSELLGRSRAWMIYLPWASMFAISLFQYGYGAAVPALSRTYGWSLADTLSVLAVWVAFQAGVTLPALWLYQQLRNRLAAPMFVGATMCLVALVTLAHTGNLVAVLLGYSVLGGIGAGLVYATCIATVTEWFPERTASRVSVVSGAFGYGAIPFVVVAAYVLRVDNHATVLNCTAVGVFVIVGISGLLMRKPSKGWWPAEIDPQFWAVNRRLNRSLPKNVPAGRPYSARGARRIPALLVVVVLAAAMTLFDVAYLASFAQSSGRSVVTAVVIGSLALSTGVGRTVIGSWSDRLGRRGTLGVVLALGGVAQLGLLFAVHGQHSAAVVAFAGLAGTGTGASYPLLMSMVRDWFGDDAKLTNYGIVYAGKALGGTCGIGLAGLAVTRSGSTVAFVLAASLGLLGCALTRTMRQPGPPAARSAIGPEDDEHADSRNQIQRAIDDAREYSMRTR